jgi:hypothetical protein
VTSKTEYKNEKNNPRQPSGVVRFFLVEDLGQSTPRLNKERDPAIREKGTEKQAASRTRWRLVFIFVFSTPGLTNPGPTSEALGVNTSYGIS